MTLDATLAGIFAPFPFSSIGDGISIASNLSLKFIPAPLEVPGARARSPNSADGCTYDVTLPQAIYKHSDIFGIPLSSVPDNWGALGKPDVAHAPPPCSRRRRSSSPMASSC